MKDLENREDIEKLVDHFYGKLVNVEGINAFFGKELPLDWAHHKPIMVGFWDFILFNTPNAYLGNVMNPHFTVNEKKMMLPEHFEQWLTTFNESVDELFVGPKAEDAKNSAFNIGATMKYKIKKENAGK
jgi:hemoglobin